MYINGEEVTSDNLIDNDLTTCELLHEGDGCRMNKVVELKFHQKYQFVYHFVITMLLNKTELSNVFSRYLFLVQPEINWPHKNKKPLLI